jgi:ABC-2 type transport system ATP-binding protein
VTTDGEPWAIEARGLTKTFGTVTAVRGLTLQVPSGTIFAFLGPNGSGKSTTVRLLTGLLAPTAGEARVIGRVVSVEDLELRRTIGILPEDDALFPDLTIWEHLELCGALYGLDRQETVARAIQLLRHLDLEQGRTTIVEKASFGMRKKCALAMALLHNPRVLFSRRAIRGHRSRFVPQHQRSIAGARRPRCFRFSDLAHPGGCRTARRAICAHRQG